MINYDCILGCEVGAEMGIDAVRKFGSSFNS